MAIGIASGGAGVSFYAQVNSSSDAKNQPPSRPPSTARNVGAQPPIVNNPPEPGSPQARLLAQRIATRKAKALYEIAKLNRELAEIAMDEYDGVTYPRDRVTVDGEVALAQSDLKRSEDRLDWARRMFDKGFVSQATKTAEELAHKKAIFSVEQAQSKKTVLVEYTRAKTLKELRSAVAKASSDERADHAAWEAQKAKETELERQLGSGTH